LMIGMCAALAFFATSTRLPGSGLPGSGLPVTMPSA